MKPLSLRTNCSEAARISCSVAGGSKLNSVLMFLHIGTDSGSSVAAPIIAGLAWKGLSGASARRDPSHEGDQQLVESLRLVQEHGVTGEVDRFELCILDPLRHLPLRIELG